jgi:hypothetical protein
MKQKLLKIEIMKTKTFLLASALTVLTGNIFAQQPISIHVSATNPTCNGYADGAIVVNIAGGTAPYSVDGVQITGDTYVTTDVAAGVFELVISDANLESTLANVTLVEPSPIPVHATYTNVTAYGLTNGAIDMETAVPCTFYWSAINGSPVAATAQDQTGLRSDVYETIITETSTGCMTRRRFEILQPLAPTLTSSYKPDKIGFINSGASNKSVTVYPNPSSGSINIKADEQTTEAYIINEMGAVVYHINLDFETGIQSLELERGVYTLFYTEIDGTTYGERIIIK